jgi:adenosylcobalamin-dependent ribonucleoside-triphosphate reductase
VIIDLKPEQRFSLSANFLEEFKTKQPDWGPVGLITYKRTYARPLPDGRSEDWWQTCKRVVEGVYTIQHWHCDRLNLEWKPRKAQASAQEMYRLMFDMKFLPPGRGLWMMGTDYVYQNGGAALNNCAFTTTEHIAQDFAEPFCFLMDMSMLGVGVGGDTMGSGTFVVAKPRESQDTLTYVIADTREGWVDSVRMLLKAFDGDRMPIFDYSQIRPLGAPIKGFGGTAAGPEPLRRCHEMLTALLTRRIGHAITTADIVDIFNIIGVCVVAGNVRRSAEVMLGELDDQEFLNVKNPDKFQAELMSHRWMSNNSVTVNVGSDYRTVAGLTAKNGEPGYLWMDTCKAYGRLQDPPDWKDKRAVGSNPCLEQTLENYELCCLVETFPSRHDSYEEYQRTLKFAYLYAKTVTLIPTHNKKTNRVMMRNRRIGCSQSGIIQSMAKHGRRKHLNWSDDGYRYIQHMDEVYSDWLAIPRSIKTTSVKPSGTVSLLPGVTPGIHYEHAEYYFRTIRIAKISPLIAPLQEAGYPIEDDKYDSSSYVVYFPIKAQHFDRAKSDVSMWEQLENAAAMQYYWADNQVSITVTFKPEEAKDIQRALEMYESRLKSVSFLPAEDHGYVQAPYQTLSQEVYEFWSSRLKPLVLTDNVHETEDKFCDGDKCVLPGGQQ